MDIVVSSHSGVSVATVIATGSDAVAAGRAASATLSACGLPPKRTYPDLVSRQDIAEWLQRTGRDSDDVAYPTLQDYACLDEYVSAVPVAVAEVTDARRGEY